mgnify:FL=1
MNPHPTKKYLEKRAFVAHPVRAGRNPVLTGAVTAVLILSALVILAACSLTPAVTAPADVSPSIQDSVPLTATPEITDVREASSLTPVPFFSVTGSPLAPLSTQQPIAAEFKICSPLSWETIPELSEIVADPYNPPPPERAEERHHGVDFSHYSRKGHASILGEPVQAVLGGVVAASISDRLPYGNMVIIETYQDGLPDSLVKDLGLQPDQSLYLLYGHLENTPLVKLGELVTCGQTLGTVGKTGYNIVNEHLHLETRYGPLGVRFASMAFYTTTATEQEMLSYQRWRTGGEFIHFDPFKLLDLWKLADHGD